MISLTDIQDNEALFWAKFYPFIWEDFTRSKEVEDSIQLLHLKPGQRVLDVACGYGDLSSQLAKRGYIVTGCDINPDFIEIAKDKCMDANVEWINQDIRSFKRDNYFDAIFNIRASAFAFSSSQDDQIILKNLYASLKPEGTLILELLNPSFLLRYFQDQSWKKENDRILLIKRSWQEYQKILKEEWCLLGDGDEESGESYVRLYSIKEIYDLLIPIGFHDLSSYGDLNGNTLSDHHPKLFLTAKKPAKIKGYIRV